MAARAQRPVRSRSTTRIIGFTVGAQFWFGTTLVQIERVAGPDKLLVRHLATQRLEHLSSSDLRPVEPDCDQAMQSLSVSVEGYSEAVWERARVVEEVVKKLEASRSPSKRAEARAAQQLGVSSRHLRRWRALYRTLGTLEAFLPRRVGRKVGTRLLNLRLEQLIDEEARSAIKRSADVAVNDLYPIICASARAIRLAVPARSTVARRMGILKRDVSNFDPDTARAIIEKRIPVRGSLQTTGALSIVQIDHTLADVILVDPIERRPIGRPWLTLALDVHTRMILGMLLSLEAPSSLSVALSWTTPSFPSSPGPQISAWSPMAGSASACPQDFTLTMALSFTHKRSCEAVSCMGLDSIIDPLPHPGLGAPSNG